MTIKKNMIAAIGISAVVIAIARANEGHHPLVDLFFLPGMAFNAFISGVHGNWNTPLGEFVTLFPSAIVWWFIAFTALTAFDSLFPGKTKPPKEADRSF